MFEENSATITSKADWFEGFVQIDSNVRAHPIFSCVAAAPCGGRMIRETTACDESAGLR